MVLHKVLVVHHVLGLSEQTATSKRNRLASKAKQSQQTKVLIWPLICWLVPVDNSAIINAHTQMISMKISYLRLYRLVQLLNSSFKILPTVERVRRAWCNEWNSDTLLFVTVNGRWVNFCLSPAHALWCTKRLHIHTHALTDMQKSDGCLGHAYHPRSICDIQSWLVSHSKRLKLVLKCLQQLCNQKESILVFSGLSWGSGCTSIYKGLSVSTIKKRHEKVVLKCEKLMIILIKCALCSCAWGFCVWSYLKQSFILMCRNQVLSPPHILMASKIRIINSNSKKFLWALVRIEIRAY